MVEKLKHFKVVAQFFVVLSLVFALAPCSAKAGVLNAIDVEFQFPLNKTQSLEQNSNCNSLVATAIKKEISSKKIVALPRDLSYISRELEFNLAVKKFTFAAVYSSNFNFPPKYILYKRLKVALNQTI